MWHDGSHGIPEGAEFAKIIVISRSITEQFPNYPFRFTLWIRKRVFESTLVEAAHAQWEVSIPALGLQQASSEPGHVEAVGPSMHGSASHQPTHGVLCCFTALLSTSDH